MGGARGGQDADRRVGARGEASARGNACTGLRGWEPSGYDARRIQSAEAAGSSGAWAGENDGTGTHRGASVRHLRRARVRDAEPGHQHRGDGASGDGGGLQNGSDSERCRCRPSGEGLRWSVQAAGHGAVAQQESRGAGVAPRRWQHRSRTRALGDSGGSWRTRTTTWKGNIGTRKDIHGVGRRTGEPLVHRGGLGPPSPGNSGGWRAAKCGGTPPTRGVDGKRRRRSAGEGR